MFVLNSVVFGGGGGGEGEGGGGGGGCDKNQAEINQDRTEIHWQVEFRMLVSGLLGELLPVVGAACIQLHT